MKALLLASVLVVVTAVAATIARGLLPSPPPFAEVLTGEGTGSCSPSAARGYPPRSWVPSSVATSGNGGGSGRRPPSSAIPRFFFAGDGRLRLSHAHFSTTLDVQYRRSDGTYDPAALAQINHFFRSREDGREAPIALRLVELLGYVESHYHPRQMTLLSGFRSPEFNEDLRAAGAQAAQTSLHTQGLAADVTMSGLDLRRLWTQLRSQRTGGAGYYRSGHFLHLDTGPPRFWEETTSRVGENLSAGNARIFARTDFDRYQSLDGALITLHSVTAFPILIASEGRIAGPDGDTTVTLEPAGQAFTRQDGCFAIANPAQEYALRVVSATHAATTARTNTRSHVVLATCAPRVEKTPLEFDSNPIEAARP